MKKMKKLLLPLLSILLLTACKKQTTTKEVQEENAGVESRGGPPKILVCHFKAGPNTWSMKSILLSAWPDHQAHGDVRLDDQDDDGYVPNNACGFGTQGDCDDTNAAINPGATEICGNSIDENCNGMSDDACSLAIGDAYGGGIIAYIDGTGLHGLIAAPSDQSPGAAWGCVYVEIDGADGKAIGTGNENTIDIMEGCTEPDIAASLCANLVLGGYDDWYLPSKDELHQLYINRVAIGGFDSPSEYYWSSSEFIEELPEAVAWCQKFLDGYPPVGQRKDLPLGVRAVRTF